MVVVSHLFFFFAKSFRGRCDSHESHLPLFGTIYFPTAPNSFIRKNRPGQLDTFLKSVQFEHKPEKCSVVFRLIFLK